MADARYDVLFSGELEPGADPLVARTRIKEMFKLNDQTLEQLFSGRKIAIKRDLDLDRATKFRKAFLQAGALLEVAEVGGDPVESGDADQPSEAPMSGGGGLTLAPMDSGPLETTDTVAPQQEIDTSHLSLVTTTDSTLEDVASPPPEVKLPDVSHLSLVEIEPEEDEDDDEGNENRF